jgi:hypothetical protein
LLAVAFSSVGPQPITLAWNPQPAVDVFVLYSSTNAALPLNQWQPWTNAPGTDPTVTVQMQPGAMFFFVTASNIWGESGPSNVTNTPVAPVSITNLNIHR